MAAPRLSDRIAALPAGSYRADASMPSFDDSRPLIVFDGECALCSSFARYVMRNDASARFRLTPSQSPLGRALLGHYGLDQDNPETNLLIEHGRAYGKLDAFVRIMTGLGRHRVACRLIRLLPVRLADRAYDAIAQTRYRLFGRAEQCRMAAPEWAGRIIE